MSKRLYAAARARTSAVLAPALFLLACAGSLFGQAANITATSGSGQTALLNSPFANALVATVTDASNNPVSGVTVTFFGSGIGPATALTAPNGQASAAVAANAVLGGFTVGATVSGVTNSAIFTLNNADTPTCVQTFVVTDLGDATTGSLRQGLADVCPGGTVDLSGLTTPATITLGSRLYLNQNVTIQGPAAGTVTISGNNVTRIFFMQSGTIAINNLTLANGLGKGGSGGGGAAGMGGAIFQNGGNLTMTNVALRSNSAVGGAGGTSCCNGGGGFGGNANGTGTGGSGGDLGGAGGSNGGAGGQGAGGGDGAVAGPGGFAGGGGGSGGNGGNGGFGGGGAPAGINGILAAGGGGGYGAGAGQSGDTGAGGTGGGGAGFGGAIFALNGTLNLNSVILDRNAAVGGVGAQNGQAKGGGIFVYSGVIATVNLYTFSNSTAANGGQPGIGASAAPYTNGALCPGQDNANICGQIYTINSPDPVQTALPGGTFTPLGVGFGTNIIPDGTNVTFTAPSSGASGVFTNGTNTITATTVNGYVSVPFTANGITGSYTVTATIANGPTFTFNLTNQCSNSIPVTSLSDTGKGTLRAAVIGVCPGGTINLDSLPDHSTITLASRIYINQSMTIQGPSTGTTVTISGNNVTRIFFVQSGTVAINNLTLANGYGKGGNSAGGGGAAGMGGAIFQNGGALTLTNVTLSGNQAVGGNGATGSDGGGGFGGSATSGNGANGGDLGGTGGGLGTSGTGGNGGAGAGGGAGVLNNGGLGGFGAGGGGAYTPSLTDYSPHNGGAGGFGGGGGQGCCYDGAKGGAGGYGGGEGTFEGSANGDSGGGGAGLGGAIFELNGTLNLNSVTFTASTTTGGTASAVPYTGQANGQAKGGALFVYYGATANFSNVTFSGSVAANAGQPGSGNSAAPYTNGATCPGKDTVDICGTVSILTPLTPELVITKSHIGNFTQGSTGVWTIHVINTAGDASAVTNGSTVTVQDTLPANYTLASSSGTDWSCNGTNIVTCTNTDVIAGAGASFPVLTLTANVPANSPTSVRNNVLVYGGGDPNHTNATNAATAFDTATVISLTSVTINVPAGVGLTLNSVSYTGSQTVSLAPGQYTLTTTSPQSLGVGSQAVFSSWSDSGALSHSITVGSSAVIITGTFTTQYLLTTSVNPVNTGTVTGGGVYYNANSNAPVSANPAASYIFSSWTGAVAFSTSATTTVSMTSPQTATANFAPNLPVISNLQAVSVGGNSEVVSWTTDQPSTTQVNYGPTSSYGSSSPLNGALVAFHSVTLSNLPPNTTYNYDVVSTNSTNGTTTSTNATFKTTPYVGYVAFWGVNNSGVTISWSTDVPANTFVAYGTTSALGQLSPVQSALTNSHGVVLTGLNPGTTYYFRAESTTAGGSTGGSTIYTFTTTGVPASPAPVITKVAVTNITTTSATISWTTDQAASSQVNYGATTAYGSSSPLYSILVTSHSINLTGLTPGTTYNYDVISTNSSGTSSGMSTNYTFATTGIIATPPAITNIQAMVTTTTATITWTTDQAANSQVKYGATTSYGSATTPDSNYVTSHSVTLTNLAPGTTYNFAVVSTNAAALSTTSPNGTFLTTASNATAPYVGYVAFWGINNSGVTISWSTDVLANTQVAYGTTSALGQFSPLQSTLTASHGVVLTGLNSGTTYYFQAQSTGTNGATGYSTTYSFTTTGSPSAPAPMISNIQTSVTTNSATITWTTDQAASSQVNYGVTTTYTSSSTLSPTLTTSHSVTLNNLMPGTTYNFDVMSSNVANLSATSPNATFQTTGSAPGPVISKVAASSITSSTALITWTTDQASTSVVNYGTSTTSNPTLVTSHSVMLTGLTPNTTYTFSVTSANASSVSTTSSNYSFTTSTPSAGAPVVSNVAFWGITGSGVTISWSTNVPSNTSVAFGTAANQLSQTSPVQTPLTNSHGVTLTGLNPGTTYYFQAQSADVNGNTGYSTIFSFTTIAGPPTISAVTVTPADNHTATISWTTSAPTYSYVQYGPAAGVYGRYSAQTNLTATPPCTLGYVPSGVNHYQLVSTDANGNQVVSPDATFIEP